MKKKTTLLYSFIILVTPFVFFGGLKVSFLPGSLGCQWWVFLANLQCKDVVQTLHFFRGCLRPIRPHRLRGQPLFDLGALPGCTYKQARSKSKHATGGKSSNTLHCEQLSTYLVATRLSNLLYIEVLQWQCFFEVWSFILDAWIPNPLNNRLLLFWCSNGKVTCLVMWLYRPFEHR